MWKGAASQAQHSQALSVSMGQVIKGVVSQSYYQSSPWTMAIFQPRHFHKLVTDLQVGPAIDKEINIPWSPLWLGWRLALVEARIQRGSRSNSREISCESAAPFNLVVNTWTKAPRPMAQRAQVDVMASHWVCPDETVAPFPPSQRSLLTCSVGLVGSTLPYESSRRCPDLRPTVPKFDPTRRSLIPPNQRRPDFHMKARLSKASAAARELLTQLG
ncbi:uncharacterized protein VTP21DRAFT_3361 [Calcarisporiella thermophila]|uniref:uncharacterized protein n=1 Tax=Calcarisporiella thermophila TaxID=911321 RepID=UPI003744A63A